MSALLGSEVQIYLILFCLFFFAIAFANPIVGLIVMTFAMLFSPEFTVASLGFRAVTLRAEDALIPLLGMAWLARLTLRREFRLFAASPLNIPILSLLLISIFSTARGISIGAISSPLTAVFYIGKTAEFFTIFFLVLNYIRTERTVHKFVLYIILVGVLVGLYTLTQVPHIEIFSARRITAPFEGNPEPASVGGYLALLLLIIFSIFLHVKQPMEKFFFALLTCVVFIPFLYTLNRTSYVALLGGLFFIACVEKRKQLTFFILIFLVLSPVLLPQPVKERIVWTWKGGRAWDGTLPVDASLEQRIYAFRRLWVTGRDSLLIGWGVCSWETPDSQYARTLYEIGILGLGLWIWIFRRLFRISKWLFESLEEGVLKGFVLGYRAGLLGIAIHGFGAVTFYIVRIMEPFWFVSGLVVSLYLIKVGEEKMKVREEPRVESLLSVEDA